MNINFYYPVETTVQCFISLLLQIFWNAGCQMVALNFQTLGN